MAEKGKSYYVKGILRGIETSAGNKNGKDWTRASFKIETEEGKQRYISTFDAEIIKQAQKAMNGEVKLTYTKDPTGKYNNLDKDGFQVIGQGENPVTEEEVVGEEEEPEGETEKESTEPEEEADKKYNIKKMDSDPSNKTKQVQTPIYDSNSYWKTKFDWEVKTNEDKQLLIIRQSCLTNAIKLAKTSVKAVELGILTKEEFGNKDLYPKEIFDIAEKMVSWVKTGKKE